ncbi:hypothetical protein ACLX1H_002585 [Fusarium chlamydosporum]
MKLSVFTSVVLAGLVAAQQEKLPNNKNFLSGIACCLEEKCDTEGKDTAVKYAKQICSTAGVTDLPDDVTCDKSAASGSASSSGTASGTATGATTSTSSESQASATGDSDKAGSNAGSREGAAGIFGVAMAMLFAL